MVIALVGYMATLNDSKDESAVNLLKIFQFIIHTTVYSHMGKCMYTYVDILHLYNNQLVGKEKDRRTTVVISLQKINLHGDKGILVENLVTLKMSPILASFFTLTFFLYSYHSYMRWVNAYITESSYTIYFHISCMSRCIAPKGTVETFKTYKIFWAFYKF